jgi:ABC-type oligopeptide transport system ATPase subunit
MSVKPGQIIAIVGHSGSGKIFEDILTSIVYPTFFCILHLGDFKGIHPKLKLKNSMKVIFQLKFKCRIYNKCNKNEFSNSNSNAKMQLNLIFNSNLNAKKLMKVILNSNSDA